MKRVLLFAGGDDRNFWLVQSIRQTLHSNTFLILSVVILVSDALCALSLSRGHLSLMDLPGWNVMQLIFCSAGALIALSGCFMRKNRHKRSGGSLQHYLDFSPIEPGRLLTGILLSFTLYYIFFLLLVSPFLILALVHVKESWEYLPIWIVCGYLIPLFLYFAGNSGKIRMEFLLFAFYTFFLLAGGDKDLSWLESGFFLTALLYSMVIFRSTLLPLSMEHEGVARICQFLLLLAASGCLYRTSHFSETHVIVLAGGAALGAVSSAFACANNLPRRAVKGAFPRRVAAFLFRSDSAGGWIWACLILAGEWWILDRLPKGATPEFWQFACLCALFSGETGVLLLRRFRNPLRGTFAVQNMENLCGIAAFALTLLLIGTTFFIGAVGRMVSENVFFLDAAFYALLLVLLAFLFLLPDILEDAKRFLFPGRKAEK